jgi:L-iditol 2-dehydrogenase
MRVAMYYNNRDVRVEEMPTPRPGPGELVVRIMASGICGSDAMEWYRVKHAPLVLGHEVAGEIAEVGEGVESFKVGDRVAVAHHVPCNTCVHCRKGHFTTCHTLRTTNFDPGGFAELVRLPAINVDRGTFLLPDEVSYEEATFAEPLACVLRGHRMARIEPGDSVLVIGCGIAGLLFVDLLRALGAGRIMAVDVSDYRLEAARRFGAEHAFKAGADLPARVRQVNSGMLADRVVVCTGNRDANAQALECVERGGCILFFAPTDPGAAIPLPVGDFFFRNDRTLTTSYAGSPADYAEAVDIIRAGRVRVRDMITHRLALAEASQGFQLVEKADASIKVIIEPQR